MLNLKVRKIGNASGVILPREILNRMHVKDGDKLYFTEAPDGTKRKRIGISTNIKTNRGNRFGMGTAHRISL